MSRRRERQYEEAVIHHKRKNSLNSLLFVVYIFIGVYFLNDKINFLSIPEFMSNIHGWIIFIGGVLIILASFRFLKKR